MPSDRQLIELDKAFLRREYPATTDGLAHLKALAKTFYESDPSNVELTGGAFEGGSGSGQLTSKRDIRRLAIEELIAERDPAYILPVVKPQRPIGITVQLDGCYRRVCY